MTIRIFSQYFFILTTAVLLCEGASFLDLYFLEEPKDVAVAKGSTALFNCVVHRNTNQVEISWMKDGTLIQYDSRRHQLSNGSLFIEYVEHTTAHKPDEGYYQCRASAKGIGTIVSRKATLQLHYLRMRSGYSRSPLSCHLGDMVMLACPVDGLPFPSVSWYKNGKQLDLSGADYFPHSHGSFLEILSVKSSDFGSYRCQAAGAGQEINVSMEITQETDRLSYQGVVPEFVMRPSDQNLKEGGVITLPCAANGRDRNGKQPHITWLKNGATLELNGHTDGRMRIEGKGSLRIQQLQESDTGLYTCRATNKEDSLDVDVMLQVLAPPRFVRRPSNLEASLNSDVELECDVIAKPSASIEWSKNGDVVIPSDYFQIIEGKHLRILGLVASDEGMYQCFASNSVGNIQSSAQLIIQQKASWTTTPSSQKSGVPLLVQKDVTSQIVVNLTASLVSSSHVTLTWKLSRSGEDSSEVLGYLVSWKEDESPRERFMNTTALEVDILHLKPSTKYTFRVSVYGLQGVSPNSATVVVHTLESDVVPGQPTNLEVTVLSPTSARVTWENPAMESTAEPITHYKLYYGVSGDDSGELDVNIVETQYTVTSLLKFSEYSFRVVAYNAKGPGPTSSRVTAQTFSDVPSSAPQNFAAEAAGSSSILVSWEPPPDGSRNGVITGYKIQYKQRREKSANMITTDGSQHSFNISGLEKGTEYVISVQAQTVNGSGPSTSVVSAKTFMHDLDESTVPGKPISLQVRPVANTVIVSWTPPVEQDIMIRGYVLGYGEGLPDTYRQVLDARSRHHTIRGLRPSIQYVISLKAFNNMGEGFPIYDTVTTREETTPEPQTPMMPPVGLKTIVRSSTSMILTWSDTTLGRSQRVSDSRYYTVRYNPKFLRKFKMVNCTDLLLQVDDLQPDTEYEFSVKVSRGSRHSTWSLSVFNKTEEAAPSSVPRNLTVVSVRNSASVVLTWQPPKQRNGQITAYLIYYSTDLSIPDYDWIVEKVNGERLTATIHDLIPETTYYFKIRAQNDVGYGPLSSTTIFLTPKFDGSDGGIIETPDDYHGRNSFARSNSKNNWLSQTPTRNKVPESDGSNESDSGGIQPGYLWIIIGCLAGTFLVILLIIGMACFLCRRSTAAPNSETPDAQKGTVASSKTPKPELNDLKPPPDLWIHGNIEISDLDRASDADSSTTAGRSAGRSYYDKVASDEDGYQNLSLRPLPASLLPLDDGHHKEFLPSYEFKFPSCSNQPLRHDSFGSRTPGHQVPPRVNVADILQTGSASRSLKPQSNSKVSSGAPSAQPLISPPPICLTSKLCENYNGSDELTEEMANIEGLMKDLSDITRQQFSY